MRVPLKKQRAERRRQRSEGEGADHKTLFLWAKITLGLYSAMS